MSSIASTTGAALYISGTGSTPTANSTADSTSAYAALTYVKVGTLESIGEFGDTASTITFTSLDDGRVRKRKGVRDAGELSIACANDPTDNGQKAMIAAQLTDFSYAFKVVLADGADSNDTDSILYFRGLVSKASLSVGAANEIVKRNFTVLIDSKVVEIPSAIVSGP